MSGISGIDHDESCEDSMTNRKNSKCALAVSWGDVGGMMSRCAHASPQLRGPQLHSHSNPNTRRAHNNAHSSHLQGTKSATPSAFPKTRGTLSAPNQTSPVTARLTRAQTQARAEPPCLGSSLLKQSRRQVEHMGVMIGPCLSPRPRYHYLQSLTCCMNREPDHFGPD